jgi:hypothetical protein
MYAAEVAFESIHVWMHPWLAQFRRFWSAHGLL